jgi:hypothetical protein
MHAWLIWCDAHLISSADAWWERSYGAWLATQQSEEWEAVR